MAGDAALSSCVQEGGGDGWPGGGSWPVVVVTRDLSHLFEKVRKNVKKMS
jgi:hypothetical protein